MNQLCLRTTATTSRTLSRAPGEAPRAAMTRAHIDAARGSACKAWRGAELRDQAGLARPASSAPSSQWLTLKSGPHCAAGAPGVGAALQQQRSGAHRRRRRQSLATSQSDEAAPLQQGPSKAPEIYLGLPSRGSTCDSALAMPGVAPATGLLAAAVALLLAVPPAEAAGLSGAVDGLEELIQSAGAAGPLIFIAAYIAATVLLVPASVLTLAAGFLFGPALGTAVVSVASTAGACAAFLVGRYLARPAVQRRIEGNARFSAVDAAIAREGWRIVLLLRLSPLFPFSLLNYALSLTSIELAPYALASWAGMLPGTVAYVALGGAGRAAAETAGGAGGGPLQLALYAVGAGATLWATALISKAASRALDEAAGAEGDAAQPLGGGGSRDDE